MSTTTLSNENNEKSVLEPSTTDGEDEKPEVEVDGGLRAWLVVAGAFMTVFCGFGLAAAAGAFQSYYRATLLSGYTESQVSWITSAQSFGTFAPAIFTGSLFDKYGHRPLVAIGGTSLALGFLLLSFSTRYYQIILCHGSLIAWGCNLLFISPMSIVGQWFFKRRGLAFGITSCGSSIGSIVWPLVIANLPPKVGFGWTCRVLALIASVCGVLSFFLMKTRLPPKPKGKFLEWSAFKNVQYTLIVLSFWTWTFGFFAFQIYIGTYGSVLALGSFVPYLLIIANGSSTIGRLGAGILADRIGVYNTIVIGNAILAVMLWVWLACKTLGSCVALCVIVGIASGAFVSLQSPVANKTSTDPLKAGTLLGQAVFIQSFASFSTGPTFGAVVGEPSLETFAHAIYLGASMMTVALCSLSVARLMTDRRLFAKL